VNLTPVLETRDLVKDFGPLRAVDGVSFSLAAGRLLSIFGPNGAGKTSLLRLLGGLLHPTSGAVRIQGERVGRGDPEWRRRVGVLSHKSFLYGHLTASENLEFFGRLYGLQDLRTRVPERLARVGLDRWAEARARDLSRGMRQRLALARTLLHDPSIVLLDEPWTGLDPHAAVLLREILEALKDGQRTVVLVTHNLSQGLELADHVAIQVQGRIAFFGSRGEVDANGFEKFYRETVERAP
jgi:heme exporter protein A